MGSQGTANVVVSDSSGGIVQGAKLSLQDAATNTLHAAETQQNGTYTFVNLPLGVYKLTVVKDGFQTEVLDAVEIQGGRVTDVKVTLRVGAAVEKVVVTETTVPLVELTSSAISTTIDTKQIEELPLQGRDISSLAQLSPGYSGTGGFGTWNGLPVIAQGNTIDGVVSSTSRMKFSGNVQPGLEARLEDIQEMTVQSSQTDLDQGLGMTAMQVNFVTRRGSNDYHGRIFEDFRNTALNANSWVNDATLQQKAPIILNEFGGSVGGHIIKDKLFFFGSFSMAKQPGGYFANSQVLSPAAQQGILTEQDGTQVNLFTQVAQPNNLPNCAATPSICQAFATQQALINKAVSSGGVAVSASGDANFQNISWLVKSPITRYYPAFRVDYNATSKVRIDFSFEDTKVTQPNASAPLFPGPDFSNQAASFKSSNYISSVGVNWTITPTLINQFRGGYYYNAFWYAFGGNPTWDTLPQINWGIGASGEGFNLPVITYYPIVNASDNATWVHKNHAVSFGFNFFREQDHYWNPPDGIPSVNLALVNGDPAFQPFENAFPGDTQDTSDAENLYATLIGRISGIGPVGSGFPYSQKTGQYATKPGSAYNLDELQKGWGLYAQDSFRLTPRLTVNYGLRWDFTGDDHDLTSAYHGASQAEIFGPSTGLFKPGTLSNNLNPAYVASSHQYNGWNVTPQPTIGLAWNPGGREGFLGKLLGGNSTVIRAGFDIKRFTEPYQYFWNSASNHGLAFFQSFSLQPVACGGGGGPCPTGTFPTGALALPSQPTDANLATVLTPYPYSVAPPAYAASLPQSLFTWNYYFSGAGIDPNIKEPYVQQWNLGIQRQLGSSNVLEVRYLGHRTLHQWIGLNTNEVNIFENGFLQEFKNAESNLKICLATPSCASAPSFGNQGLPGQVALPIFDAAFKSESGGAGTFSDYQNGSFITDLKRGAAGTLALQLAYPFGNAPYICNLVGSSLSTCATQYGSTTPGPYPVNFFQANPYADGIGFKNFGDTAANASFLAADGYGTYHALQVDFRQKQWHGMQFDVNYTWSHTLGVQPDGQWTGAVNIYTLRDLGESYSPTLFDLRHVLHASGTYDLPFGQGKTLLNRGGVVDKVVGGWTLGTIFTYQTGFPFQLSGAYHTFNEYGPGGMTLSGIGVSQIQSALGVRDPNCTSACGYVNDINPALLIAAVPGSPCQSHLANVCQNVVPGTFGSQIWLYGPHLWNDDLSLSKVVPFGERFKFSLQGEFLNVFNHPNFANPTASISSSSFGHSGPSNFNGPRVVELRANISF